MSKKKYNPRNRCRGGDYLMPVSFRDYGPEVIRLVQLRYSEGYYSQEELAEILGKSVYIVKKMVRCDPANLANVKPKPKLVLRRKIR